MPPTNHKSSNHQSTKYEEFLIKKAIIDNPTGVDGDIILSDIMKPHQSDITRWALRRGRAAIFAGTGLGKTFMELSWAQKVNEFTKKPILIFAPLAVAEQHIREASKFGIDARLVTTQSDVTNGINVTNYQKIDHFDLSIFGGIVLDESSILKNVDGKYRTRIIEECANIPFRLAATATPSPNDFMELGNHSEFLGIMSYTDMLSTFFTHDGGETQKWRLKGHAENDFWKWMASWAVMLRKPSDLGYENSGYDLPPLIYHQHTVKIEYAPSMETGMLFPMEANTMQERISARRDSIKDRVLLAAEITPNDGPFVWWCNLNSEAEMLTKLIPGAVNLHGGLKDSEKSKILVDFSDGKIQKLVTKASLAGFGMNWQHCNNAGFVGLNDSFEQVFQAVRRFWRFGQDKEVNVHFIASELEGATVANIKRKEQDAERMAAAMIMHTASLASANIRGQVRDKPLYDPQQEMKLPYWLS